MTAVTNIRPSDWALNVRTGLGGRNSTSPRLGNFTHHYGVQVSDIGEDGDMIALGHVGKLRALAAFNRHARTVWGEVAVPGSASLRAGTWRQPLVGGVEHVWMVNEGTAEEWRLSRVQSRGSHGAFPVTYWVA